MTWISASGFDRYKIPWLAEPNLYTNSNELLFTHESEPILKEPWTLTVCGTYPGVGADVHLQAIVLAESLVTVRTLVGTLTWQQERHQNPEMCPQRVKALQHSSLSNWTAFLVKEKIWIWEKLQIILPERDAVLDQNIPLCWLILHYNMWIHTDSLGGNKTKKKTPNALAQTTFCSDLHMVTFMVRH